MISRATHLKNRHLRLFVLGLAAAVMTVTAVSIVIATRRPLADKTISIGKMHVFPEGSVKELVLHAVFNDPNLTVIPGASTSAGPFKPIGRTSPVRVFVVNDRTQGLLVLFSRDPHLGCRVRILRDFAGSQERDRAIKLGGFFEDPCHGELFTYTGDCIGFGCSRGLGRFSTAIEPGGEVIVNLIDFHLGAPRA